MTISRRTTSTVSRTVSRDRTLPALIVGLVLFLPASADAQSAARKCGRGLAAMTTSFLEVPGNMVRESRARGEAGGIPLGFVKGLGGIVVRTLVGVYEFVTCPFEMPDGFAPILEPEFPWGYFDETKPAARRSAASRADDRGAPMPVPSGSLSARPGRHATRAGGDEARPGA